MSLIGLFVAEFKMNDRHKTARVYSSGASKRKHAKEKKDSALKELSKMPKITKFVKHEIPNASAGTVDPPIQVTHDDNPPQTNHDESDESNNQSIASASKVTSKGHVTINAPVTDDVTTSSGLGNDIGKWPVHL